MGKHLSMSAYRRIAIIFFDAAILSMAFFISLFIKNDFSFNLNLFRTYLYAVPVLIIVFILVFQLIGMYKSMWEYASFEEVFRGIIACTIGVALAYFISMVILPRQFYITDYILGYLVITPLLIGYRIAFRFIRILTRNMTRVVDIPNTLIIGAGNAGVMVLKGLLDTKKIEDRVVGFLDDDAAKYQRIIRGIPVLGTIEDLEIVIKQYRVDQVVVAIPTLPRNKMLALLNRIEKTKAKIRILPPFYEILNESQTPMRVRDVRIEDLLGRETVNLEQDNIKDYLKDQVVLVTGGGGSIGSELCRQIRLFNPKTIIVLDNYENNAYDLEMEFARLYKRDGIRFKPTIHVEITNVRDYDAVEEVFIKHHPNVVFHAAAHKHVPLMENNPKEAVKNNIFGTYNVAKLSDKYKVSRFVLISTDKAVNPTNIMGASKRFAERVVNAYHHESKTRFAAVRFGNVLGSDGSVIPLFKKQIDEGGPVTVTHKDIIRYFMTIPEACQLVIQAGVYAQGDNLFVLDMGEPVKIIELAEKMIRLSGFEPYRDIEIEFTGLRPGEKMFEELLINTDKIERTTNEKIFIESDFKESVDKINKELEILTEGMKSNSSLYKLVTKLNLNETI